MKKEVFENLMIRTYRVSLESAKQTLAMILEHQNLSPETSQKVSTAIASVEDVLKNL